MNKPNYNVAVILFTDNSINSIDRSLQSIFNQTFDPKSIKVIIFDNYSSDGTYEKLVKLTQKNNNISIYRLDQKYLQTKLLYKALSILEYCGHKYLTILSPGDILYPEFIERTAMIMDEHANSDRKVLLCEADIADTGNILNQTPVFTNNCILKKRVHHSIFFNFGLGHKIQAFFCNNAMPKNFPDLPFYVDYTDWFKKASYSFITDCIYIKESLACISPNKYNDILTDLILRFYLIKKLEITRTVMHSNIAYSYSNELKINQTAYEKLSFAALYCAYNESKGANMIIANKILLFAEMVNKNIVETEFYKMLKNSILVGQMLETDMKYIVSEKCIPPPEGTIIF